MSEHTGGRDGTDDRRGDDALASAGDLLTGLLDRVTDAAGVETVYGEPVEAHGRTVIPVAKVAYGFGAGGGSERDRGDADPESDADPETDSGADPEADPAPAESGGSGGGGGLSARPVGLVEITDGGTRFVRFDDRRRLAVGLLVGAALGYLLGRRRGE